MQKGQRLLDVAAFLLRAAEPVPWREIQEHFPDDYGGSEEAAIRKFERDKAELIELGVPVRYVAPDEDLPAGYVIDKDAFYLPDLKLAPEDLALLYLAGSAALAQGAFPYARDLAHALNKLSFAARAPGAAEAAGLVARRLSTEERRDGGDGALASRLEELARAVAARKRIHITYFNPQKNERVPRDVDPYGLYQSGGAWYVSGWCHLRQDIRTFHVNRIEALVVNAAAPRTPDFEPRPDFRLADLATRERWEYAEHPPVECTVRLDPPVSLEARGSFGPRARLREEAGALFVDVTATNTEALVRHVLWLGDRAEILAPPEVRDRARKVLKQLHRRLA
jgi:proteasome accessory factor B